MSSNHVLSSEVTGFHIYEEDNRLHKDCSTRYLQLTRKAS